MQKNTIRKTVLATFIGLSVPVQFAALAAELNTALPQEADEGFSVPMNLDMPAQPLAAALRQFSIQSNLSLTVDSNLIVDKKSPAIKGRMTRKEAIKRLLDGTGLQGRIEGEKIFIQRAVKEEKTVQVDKVEVRAKRFYEIGPLPGLGLTKEEIPGNVQSISAKEIKEAHSLSLADLMNRKLQSVTVNDYQGNPFQMDVQYRGFSAGPQIGTPQGLSVFLDGIRMNEPFGDVVNWDMMPMNALESVEVFPGSNPIFGLNTLGGAFALKTKDGFNNAGVDADILTGSFGRKQLQVEGGWNNGTVGLFAAGNFFLEDGWRTNSPSKVNQLFTKASYRGDKLDLNLSALLVQTDLVGNGLVPSEMYAQDRNSVFTSPDTTKNRLQQFQLSSSYFVNDTFSITGQIYRRNSKRHQKGSDVMTNWDDELTAKRLPKPADPANGTPAEEFTCTFTTTTNSNQYGLPDYLVIPINVTQGEDIFTSNFFNDVITNVGAPGSVDLRTAYSGNLNAAITSQGLVDTYRYNFNLYSNFTEQAAYNRNAPPPPPSRGDIDPAAGDYSFLGDFDNVFQTFDSQGSGILFNDLTYFYTAGGASGTDVIRNYVMLLPATNESNCLSLRAPSPGYVLYQQNGIDPKLIDGAGTGQPGYVQGTPTALLTDNQIDQIVDGASIQFNWNLEHHKFMVGAAIDAASADYTNSQRLGFFDADRNGYLDPAQAHPQFVGAFIPIENNNFTGTNTTKSVYFSETWTPVDDWHFNVSARYNETQTKNKIAARRGLFAYEIGDVIAIPSEFAVCPDGDCSNVPLNFRLPSLYNQLDSAETEKFSYYSLNPSIGATWQAKENLNIYANVAQGTRTPSVIELGCALDHTPTGKFYSDGQGGTYEVPKSILENRQCTLPTTLSGDPYLPQIKATTYDIGMRGTIGENMRWNLGAFQTDLKDDIYFVAVGNSQGFFDTIGKTRRRGIEAGLSGKEGRLGFGLNYSLTDATFQDDFYMMSEDNSSSFYIPALGRGVIKVKAGDRMPGAALHNLNANLTYDLTDKWVVGLTAVMHSGSYARGNENNEHKQGVTMYREVTTGFGQTAVVPRQQTTNPGTLPGYATFNFQTSYKINKEWTATMIVNNIFDKEYFSAGRLGRNPFSPSILGAIGPDGYNHNSSDWLSTNFVAPGAPRGVWFSLNWHFVPD
ncbi:Outer membrane receptor proteins, mostly Fe transport [Methylophilus rhizosphaerae]|uniref:Outer membrane receptor proteins, mostly Fe transport n=1 Tax=Methylophilus rhizosphaerae TaxID=492660 RepID=A0A1G8ZEW2_9PROT|nr:TonB-dependent receptor [Methylophilus rhizosphaerae]SDK13567.1 Outer membrane receptor proteins, mostly Fe transport [Methylophilus rhizosphaerae]